MSDVVIMRQLYVIEEKKINHSFASCLFLPPCRFGRLLRVDGYFRMKNVWNGLEMNVLSIGRKHYYT